MLIHNLKLSVRSLKKNKLYTYLNITGFAVGFAVVAIISVFIHNEMRVDHNFSGHENIYRLISATDENDCLHDFQIGSKFRDAFPEVQSASPVQYISDWSFNVSIENNFVKLSDMMATNNQFFEIFDLELIEGISSEPFTELNSAVITESLAAKLFGDENPIGKKINIGGFLECNINGVVTDFPPNSSFLSQLFLNIESEPLRIHESCNDGKCIFPANIYIKLSQANDKALLEEKINQKNDLTQQESEFWLQPLTDIYFDKEIKNNSNRTANTSMIYLFAGIAVLILLLSVFNHVNFSISLQFSKLRSIGIKKTNGAGFPQLAAFLITENVVAVLAAFILSLGLVILVLPLVNQVFDWHLNAQAMVAYPVNLIIAFIILATVAITSMIPLYMMARFDIRKFLSNEIIKTRGGSINQIISVFQITASIILIIGVFVIYRQLSYAKHADLGFHKEHLLKINLPGDFKNGNRVKAELSKFSFVRSSTLSMGAPGTITLRIGSETEEFFWLNNLEVDEDFTKTFGLEFITGRNFRHGDEDKACIVNETALKKFGWNTIDDKTYREEYKVIGLVKDFHVTSFHSAIEPAVLVFKDRFKNTLSMHLEIGHTRQQIAQLKEAWEEVVPDQPFDFVFYDEFFNALYQKEERLGQATGIFSALAFMITLMGMAGLVFQTCLNRTKEIGVRKVNGAKVIEVMTMLNKDFVKRVAIAFLIACPLAWYTMNKWLENFAYKTDLSWWIFALAGMIALGIALLTVSWQSWKAATRNPVEALRYE